MNATANKASIKSTRVAKSAAAEAGRPIRFGSSSEEVPLNWNNWVRQFHRWLSIIFTVVVTAIFITLGVGVEPAYWVYLMPLIPLALLTLSGLYLFALPYATRWRSGRRTGAEA